MYREDVKTEKIINKTSDINNKINKNFESIVQKVNNNVSIQTGIKKQIWQVSLKQ